MPTRELLPPRPEILRAAEALREGNLVVFPTETVYGVGANALDAAAVRRIYEAKGRPSDNPVIVHVADTAAAKALALEWPDEAEKLANKFWPGPLTLVVRRSPRVPDATTGSLDNVALRVPDHAVALALLQAFGGGVAAPSANRSGSPSPTRCADAREDLGDAVAVYLDGGPTRVGVESTVVDVSGRRPTLLRPGGVPREAIEAVVGPLAEAGKSQRPLAPGMKYRHYAPRTPLRIVEPQDLAALWRAPPTDAVWLVSTESALTGPNVRVVASRRDAAGWARQLFALLRDVDKEQHALMVVEAIPETGVGAAVMNRLRKAAEG